MSSWSSPVNLEWAVDNRTTGFRVPDSPPEARRIENRLAGSDAMRESLGDEFVTAYAAMKEKQYRDYQQRIPEWELAELMDSV